jgi:hypothetical protein
VREKFGFDGNVTTNRQDWAPAGRAKHPMVVIVIIIVDVVSLL